jgi:hypothetical protein
MAAAGAAHAPPAVAPPAPGAVELRLDDACFDELLRAVMGPGAPGAGAQAAGEPSGDGSGVTAWPMPTLPPDAWREHAYAHAPLAAAAQAAAAAFGAPRAPASAARPAPALALAFAHAEQALECTLDLAAGERPRACAPWRCFPDTGHAADCALCTRAPAPGEEAHYEARARGGGAARAHANCLSTRVSGGRARQPGRRAPPRAASPRAPRADARRLPRPPQLAGDPGRKNGEKARGVHGPPRWVDPLRVCCAHAASPARSRAPPRARRSCARC